MEFGTPMLALSTLGVIAVAMGLPALKRRLELSLAKHRSLTGHVRMARRIAGLIPFYAYDEAHFFACDDAPAEIAEVAMLPAIDVLSHTAGEHDSLDRTGFGQAVGQVEIRDAWIASAHGRDHP